ncbi:MAG: hypothetical protein KatS3mg110_3848 [Pirellulaceae bacterium]|nr:MAG: hypothetical protein KatS3mg110_3848 [Pirellulaceae bacterium]
MPPGLLTILKRVDEVWRSQEEQLRQNARTIARVTRVELENQPIILDSRLPQDRAAWQKLWNGVEDALAEQFDPQYGGFGFDGTTPNRPKFPEPPNLFYLLDRLNRLPSSEKEARDRTRQLLRTTLTQMALGGIRDHLAGGFHRYSVDRFWRVPHFEKMLYDNAQLLSVYSRASALFEDSSLSRSGRRNCCVSCAAKCAHRKVVFTPPWMPTRKANEGRYYVWQRDELNNVLPPALAELFLATYRLAPLPPPDDQHCVVYLEKKWDDVAREKGDRVIGIQPAGEGGS